MYLEDANWQKDEAAQSCNTAMEYEQDTHIVCETIITSNSMYVHMYVVLLNYLLGICARGRFDRTIKVQCAFIYGHM